MPDAKSQLRQQLAVMIAQVSHVQQLTPLEQIREVPRLVALQIEFNGALLDGLEKLEARFHEERLEKLKGSERG